jgi:ABC-2 type transport system permease protein
MRLLAIARKELQQLRRDRLTLSMMGLLPLTQMLLFGYAINSDVRHIPTVVYDQDRSQQSRDFVARMVATEYFEVAGHVQGYTEAARALRRGQARVALVIPERFGSALITGRDATVQLVADGSDPQIVGSAIGTASALVADRAAELAAARMRLAGLAPVTRGLTLAPTVWYNPEERTAIYIVPGLIGVILTTTMVMFTAMAVARERERGTLEQLIVSPVRAWEIVVGKIAPYVAIGYLQMTIVLLVGWWVFRVPLRGEIGLLYACALVFIVASLAIGLLFSTLARTQQQAMQMSFFYLLPNVLLSGFMFPFEGMPDPAQWLAQTLPLTHFLRVVRRIMLQNAGLEDIVDELRWLGALLAVLLLAVTLRMKKKLL